MSYNVPVLVMIAALRDRQSELTSALLEEWGRCDTDPNLVNAQALVCLMITQLERRDPDAVVEVPQIVPGTKLNDAPEETRELVVSLLRFNAEEFKRYWGLKVQTRADRNRGSHPPL